MPSNINSVLKIGIIGGNGMLGSDLVKNLSSTYNVVSITKDNYDKLIGKSFDIVINANGNSRRYWANQNILEDFEKSTVSVYRSIFDFKFKKYIYFSSSDVYRDHSKAISTSETQILDSDGLSAYGLHKLLSEKIVRNNTKEYLILRCCLLLGTNLKKGPIYDIVNNHPSYIDLNSRLQIITTNIVANIIDLLIKKRISNNVFNIGGKGSVELHELSDILGKKLEVIKNAETQNYEMDVLKLDKLYKLETSKNYLINYIKQREK